MLLNEVVTHSLSSISDFSHVWVWNLFSDRERVPALVLANPLRK